MTTRPEVIFLIDSIIEEFRNFDLDPYGARELGGGQSWYLRDHRHEYVRTVCDVVHYSERRTVKQILEIGAFFGVVSIALSKLGFHVCAADLPDYACMPEQKERFARHGIEIVGVNLEDYRLPFPDERFDTIIMCEVLEHLNFNPLPLIKEINRVGAPESLFYLSLPNLASIHNRLNLLRGRPPSIVSIQHFFDQLDRTKPEIANGHWREYTGPEVRELLERMGYRILRQYYFGLGETLDTLTLRNRLSSMLYRAFPALKENQTTLAIRQRRTEHVFSIPNTVHKSLETL